MAANRAPVSLRLARLARLAVHLVSGPRHCMAAVSAPLGSRPTRGNARLVEEAALHPVGVPARGQGAGQTSRALHARCSTTFPGSTSSSSIRDSRRRSSPSPRCATGRWSAGCPRWSARCTSSAASARPPGTRGRRSSPNWSAATLVAVFPEGTTTFGRSLEPFPLRPVPAGDRRRRRRCSRSRCATSTRRGGTPTPRVTSAKPRCWSRCGPSCRRAAWSPSSVSSRRYRYATRPVARSPKRPRRLSRPRWTCRPARAAFSPAQGT